MDSETMKKVLELHRKWQAGEDGGQRANLQGADLQDANLRGADLQGADLQGANLQGAHLQGADLQDANLQDAHLQGAHLQGAHLQRADLQGAHLQRAHLQGAYLQGADLQDANLQGADLQDANLRGADLRGADLDFSCLPLHCGGLRFKADRRIFVQLLYHACSLDVADPECIAARNALLPLANAFHRQDVPRLEVREEKSVCPTCGASGDEHCQTASGVPAKRRHAGRQG